MPVQRFDAKGKLIRSYDNLRVFFEVSNKTIDKWLVTLAPIPSSPYGASAVIDMARGRPPYIWERWIMYWADRTVLELQLRKRGIGPRPTMDELALEMLALDTFLETGRFDPQLPRPDICATPARTIRVQRGGTRESEMQVISEVTLQDSAARRMQHLQELWSRWYA